MALHWLFPTPVLQVDLEPDAATAAAMQQQLEQFDAQVYQHPEFSDRNNLTGDLLGHAGLDQLHRMDAFQWLNGQLAEHVGLSPCAVGPGARSCGPHPEGLACGVRNGGTVDLHSHRNAQLSEVFYVSMDPANESGSWNLRRPTITSAM